MFDILIIAVQVVGLYLLADLVGGIFHWAEDTLGDVDDPIWGKVFVQPNQTHHDRPADMMKIHWLKNNIPILSFTALVLIVAYFADAMSWQLLVFAAFGGFNQQAHRFTHAPRHRLPKIIKRLQKIGVLQNAPHHWKHHIDPHVTHYCVLTPWLNPWLDKLGFWRGLERIFVPLFGAPRRPDLQTKSWYRD
ncbi:fatty acid desaturase CarF family protein [Phaeobacter marinintestinus]|uniref:fatty acid desaturase CarF family protein n=1 Tax=Falsiphaeobacter marinintestinus TaxID=1492905 RepID=UPI0011B41817|nr:fatty acid desaturase CarF family protein [Phaeobacter marinintestinus]